MSVAVIISDLGGVVHQNASVQDVPSGQVIDLFEVLIDQVGEEAWLRFRFLAPGIGRNEFDLSFAQVEGDFEHLCNTVALPYMQQFALDTDVISIAMMNRPLEFGESDAQATQYLEAFRVVDGACAWKDLW
ncbi:DUF6497 family protein [Roseobacter litoralis]|uniref:DUF6497 family protein n=1 Tax=Roseobacter litoralis TaxID=42443 RepID=UPI0024941FFD|nr:DUF6497 family protein [Roseobacter litoralis]